MRKFLLPSSCALACAVWVLAFLSRSSLAAPAPEKPALWLYCPTNFLVAENVDKLKTLWKRAADAGYTHILVADSKFAHLSDLPKNYFDNCRRAKQVAADLNLKIVPALFSVGYSNDLLFNDPNLAEGLPVRDTPFVVHGDEARLASEGAIDLSKPSYHDETVHFADGVATVNGPGGHHRFNFELALKPYRAYHVSAKIKTKDYRGRPEIKPLAADGHELSFSNLHVEHTRDWTQADIVFDTLDQTKIILYFGIWAESPGTLWWKDWKIEEVGLVNVIRREGAPCVVKSEDGTKTFAEGTDYEPIVDPKMGRLPWPGEYSVWHEPPVLHTKGIADGTRLKVSWYFPPLVYDGQVAACISAPQTQKLLREQAKGMVELWGTEGYMMSHDEFRCCNQDESCLQRKLTPGQMLAENAKMCRDLLKPHTAYVWNDMFDPYHNAVKGPYYLVNGPWTGAWEGLSPDVVIMNWNFDKRDESLKFFADRGHKQVLCGFYDNDLSDWKKWLDSGAKVKGVVGYMYTTWANDYSKLEDFAKMSRK